MSYVLRCVVSLFCVCLLVGLRPARFYINSTVVCGYLQNLALRSDQSRVRTSRVWNKCILYKKKIKRKNASLLNVNYFLACENGYYGIECNSTCGHCSIQNDCFHENGTCFNGCELGYSGDLCQNGKVNTKHLILINIIQTTHFHIDRSNVRLMTFSA